MSEEILPIFCRDLRLEGGLTVRDTARGCAVITHPHSLYGGNMDNSVVEAACLDAGGPATLACGLILGGRVAPQAGLTMGLGSSKISNPG